jgi:glycosyltransferase involved in cell wall biosynthesis
MEAELRMMIENADLEDHFQVAGLWTNTWEVYPAFDILAQTSRVEGMPFALLEAMACGCPVVAMGVGGVTEIVEVGTTGLLSAAGDWAGLGDAVIKLLDNPERMKSLGQAGRKRVEEYFDLQNSVRWTAMLFNRLLCRRTPDGSKMTGWPVNAKERDKADLSPVNIFPKKDRR